MDNIRAGFPLLEASLTHFFQCILLCQCDRVTDTKLLQIISCMNNTTCSSDPFPTRLLMSHLHAILHHIVKLCLTTGDFIVNHLL